MPIPQPKRPLEGDRVKVYERVKGGVWDSQFSTRVAQGIRYPEVRFYACNERFPSFPSHVWFDGIAFELDGAMFCTNPTSAFKSDDYVRHTMGPFDLIDSVPRQVIEQDLINEQDRIRKLQEDK